MDGLHTQIPFCVQLWIETNFHQYLLLRFPHSILWSFKIWCLEWRFLHSFKAALFQIARVAVQSLAKDADDMGPFDSTESLLPQTLKNLNSYFFQTLLISG